MERMKLFFIFILFSFLMSSGYTLAQDVFELGEVVVSGKSEVISYIATNQTIDIEEIKLNDAATVADALDNMTGLSISYGTRNEAYINVRGFNQRYVPVFYDGIPWYIPYDGYVDTGEIATGNISRITLSKGAASTLYGANTMGGVINIVSMKPAKAFEGSLSFDLGNEEYLGSLNLGGKVGKFYFLGGFTGMNADYFELSDDYESPGADSPEDGGQRENSDYKSTTVSLKAGWTPEDGHEYAIGYHTTNSEKGWPPNVYRAEHSRRWERWWRFPEWEKTTYYFIGNSRITDNMSLKVRAYRDEYYNVLDAWTNPTFTQSLFLGSIYDDHTTGASLVLRTDFIENNILSFSYHIKKDVHNSRDDIEAEWEKYVTRTSSYGIEDAFIVNEDLSIVAGLNYDVQEALYANGNDLRGDDDSFNGVLGITYGFTDKTKLHVSVAKKSRFPNQKELYSSYLDTSIPNPNLKKEQSINYEAGITSDLPFESNVGFTLFYADIKDLITETTIYDPVLDEDLDFNDNIGKSTFKGIELSFNTAYFDSNDIKLSYVYTDAENNTPGRGSDYIPETPEHQLRITDNITFNEYFSVFLKARYDKGQMEDTMSEGWLELDDYWVFDAKGMFQVTKSTQVYLTVKNILDENYSTSYGFPREGRNVHLGFKVNF
ncbi:MAG: TonB-dependent receptor [Deltaproteobacteria bacterium]|nr:TonB-dependent receptor [Deltaproteobacteria bacterium]